MDKKEQVERILHKHSANQMLTEKAIDEILLLFNVSGNEANPSKNKKDGEVAVLFAFYKYLVGIRNSDKEKMKHINDFLKANKTDR